VLHSLVTFAAETAEHHPSKTAFYVAGGMLAAFGFLIGILGTVRGGEFPTGTAGRPIMGLAALLVLATMATAIITG
jgi:hypothetical protein